MGFPSGSQALRPLGGRGVPGIAMRNFFCDSRDLRNEADVEQNFIRRLLEALGYSDRAIRPKEALEKLLLGGGGNQGLHRPDFALKVAGHIRWIVEAKAPGVNLDNHFAQANGYCESINASYSTTNPATHFVLSNGSETRLYLAGNQAPVLTLRFAEFQPGHELYERLLDALRPGAFSSAPAQPSLTVMRLKKPTITEVNYVFAKCHQHIHQSDHISQAKGFEEFVKLIALKLLSDKAVKEEFPGAEFEKQFEYPAAKVRFSVHWIEAHEEAAANPVDSIQFKGFMDDVEREIATQLRKRFFDPGERIALKPETVKGVVGQLEGLFLFGIDADLNGRLFEEFLSATMRGKDLGQYFTPRTLVKLGVGLAGLGTQDRVLDGCCGTGGFLIDALADMWAKVNANASLSDQAKQRRMKEIANERIYGIDFGKSPNLAKIARLNMYLHGDGGSRIFNVDALDLDVSDQVSDTPEDSAEKDELRHLDLASSFDVVLTNPPFSKQYDRSKHGDALVLDQYELAAGKKKVSAKILFFEMYHHYLKPGGCLISVIDDGFLTSDRHRGFRAALRSLYTVKAVVSLPGDAFQRSDARVKTSFVVLEKRALGAAEDQPSIFMYACRYVGLDDPARRRWMPGDDELRENAAEEVQAVVREYQGFLGGTGNPGYIVPPERASDRLDVKNGLVKANEMSATWEDAASTSLHRLSDVVSPKEFPASDVIDCATFEGFVQYLKVEYAGTAAGDRVIFAKTETQYPNLYRVRAGDIVISNIAATYGSVAIVPGELDGLVVSKECTVLSTKPGFHSEVVWAVLRSPEIRAEFLVRSTGANRTRIKWSDIQGIRFPYPGEATVQRFVRCRKEAALARSQVRKSEEAASSELDSALLLGGERSKFILDAFKPPK